MLAEFPHMLSVYSSGRHTEQRYTDHEVSYRDQEPFAEVLECQEYLERKRQRAKESKKRSLRQVMYVNSPADWFESTLQMVCTIYSRPLISGQFLTAEQLNIYVGKLQPSTDTDNYFFASRFPSNRTL